MLPEAQHDALRAQRWGLLLCLLLLLAALATHLLGLAGLLGGQARLAGAGLLHAESTILALIGLGVILPSVLAACRGRLALSAAVAYGAGAWLFALQDALAGTPAADEPASGPGLVVVLAALSMLVGAVSLVLHSAWRLLRLGRHPGEGVSTFTEM